MFENISASYDVGIAKKYGINCAVLLNKLIYLSKYTSRKDGYCWRTSKELEDELGLTRHQQDIAIKKLINENLIKTKNTYIIGTQIKCKHFKLLFDIDKCDLYKTGKSIDCNKTGTSDLYKTGTSDLYKSDTSDLYKTGKSVNNNNNSNNNTSNNNIYIVKQVVSYLNSKIGSNYRSTTRTTKDKIIARVNEGFVLDDFKKVIDNKWNEWHGTTFEQYLRPETLFGTKFESYLNQKTVNIIEPTWYGENIGEKAASDEDIKELEEKIKTL